MPVHAHREQRRGHLIRHGPSHLLQHLHGENHAHRRTVVAPDLRRRRRIAVIGVAVGLFLAAVVVLAVLSYGSLNAARSNLNDARNVITADLTNKTLLTTPFGRDQLQQDIGTVSKDAAEAQQELVGSESLKVLGLLPVIDTQRSGLIQLALDVESARRPPGPPCWTRSTT